MLINTLSVTIHQTLYSEFNLPVEYNYEPLRPVEDGGIILRPAPLRSRERHGHLDVGLQSIRRCMARHQGGGIIGMYVYGLRVTHLNFHRPPGI